jgi:hypothetical protein
MYVLCAWLAGEEEEEEGKNLYGNLNAPIQSQRPRRATERRLDDDGPRDSLSLHSFLFFFSPWSGRIDRPLSLSLFYSIDVRIFYSEPWPIVVFV